MIPKGDEDALAEALNDVGPLSVVLNVGDKTFDFYKTGQCPAPQSDWFRDTDVSSCLPSIDLLS